jgi:hypothetical protein
MARIPKTTIVDSRRDEIKDWHYAVECGDTVLGLDDWLEHRAEAEAPTLEPRVQGICKDCGNGTLNNALAPAFEFNGDEDFAGGEVLACLVCGSTHLDLL